jgi:hypothetical protein
MAVDKATLLCYGLCSALQVYLVPRALFKDPFRGGDNLLVMCDTYEPPRLEKDGTVTDIKPIPTNTRAAAAVVMERAKAEEPWFGIEQVRHLRMSGVWPRAAAGFRFLDARFHMLRAALLPLRSTRC